MRMNYEPTSQTRNLIAMATLAMAAIICLTPCHGPASAAVFENGQYWIGRYGADPWDIQPSIEFGELVIDGNAWTHTSQTFPSSGSFSPHDGFDLGMTVVLPKVENPAANLDGHWVHAMFRTGTYIEPGPPETSYPYAAAHLAEILLEATSETSGTGIHQDPGDDPNDDPDNFTWSVNSTSATMTVSIFQDPNPSEPFNFDIGICDGGMMFRAGLEIGETTTDDLSMDLFIKSGSGRTEQEAVGHYDVQVLMSDSGLSQWNTYRGTISLAIGTGIEDNIYHIDFEPDAMGYEPDGWSDDGTWSMDDTGRISFYGLDASIPDVFGQLNLTGDVFVAIDSADASDHECSLIIATHAPEPSVLLLLISAGPVLLLARRKLKSR